MRVWIYGGSPEEVQEVIEKSVSSERNLTPGGDWFPVSPEWFSSSYLCRNTWGVRSAAGPYFRADREQA